MAHQRVQLPHGAQLVRGNRVRVDRRARKRAVAARVAGSWHRRGARTPSPGPAWSAWRGAQFPTRHLDQLGQLGRPHARGASGRHLPVYDRQCVRAMLSSRSNPQRHPDAAAPRASARCGSLKFSTRSTAGRGCAAGEWPPPWLSAIMRAERRGVPMAASTAELLELVQLSPGTYSSSSCITG